MEKYYYLAPCHFGLESVLAGELRRMGAEEVQVSDGRVRFSGALALLARANLCLRTAERVFLLMGEFPAASFEQLFEGTKALPWEMWIDPLDAFPVKGHAISSKLHSVPDCQAIVKKAVVERLKSLYHIHWFQETGAVHRVQFAIHKDQASLLLDTSGDGLHKRGYRKNSKLAPIRETLAAGILDLARVKPFSMVYDPFCGSGTFLIESALRAANIPPGMHRTFAAEEWNQVPKAIWRQERELALDGIRTDIEFQGFGSDVDSQVVALSVANAKKAGVLSRLSFVQKGIEHFKPTTPKGIVLCNPPYGKRMLEQKEAERIYRSMGEVLLPRTDFSYYIISPHEHFEDYFGRKSDKKRKLYNGMLKCQLYQYFRGKA